MPATTAIFTQIRVTPFEKDSLRALASCKVADAFWITGLRVIEGKRGLFISMPSRKNKAGEYEDVCFPASKAMRDELQTAILAEYEAKAGAPNPEKAPAPYRRGR